ISSGKALEKLKVFIENQGGDKNIVDDYSLLPTASKIVEIKSPKSGYISKIEAEEVGVSAMILGAGRETKEDILDLSAGIILTKKVGDYVNEGDILAHMHLNKEEKLQQAKERFIAAYKIVDEKVEPKKLVYGVVTKDEIKKF
ncbi:pyrimidine-nucleoside phosphorylase, partial [Clostridium tertium]